MFGSLRKYCTQKCMLVLLLVTMGVVFFMYGNELMAVDWRTKSGPAEGLRAAPADPSSVLATAAPATAEQAVDVMDPTALLPRDPNTGWTIKHPTSENNQGANPDLFKYGKDWGINSIVVPRRNPNISGRVEPVIKKQYTGPWNQAPDRERDPYETGFTLNE